MPEIHIENVQVYGIVLFGLLFHKPRYLAQLFYIAFNHSHIQIDIALNYRVWEYGSQLFTSRDDR